MDDGLPRRFRSTVLEALRGSGALPPDHQQVGGQAPGGGGGGFTGLLRQTLLTMPSPVVLVLDDLHLATSPEVLRVLDELLRNPPRPCTWSC